MVYFKYNSAFVVDGATTDGSRIWHFAHVCAGARIGRGVSIGQGIFVGNKVVIGDGCKVRNNVSFYDNVNLEDGAFCAPSMVFTNFNTPRARRAQIRISHARVSVGATLHAN